MRVEDGGQKSGEQKRGGYRLPAGPEGRAALQLHYKSTGLVLCQILKKNQKKQLIFAETMRFSAKLHEYTKANGKIS